MRRVYGLPEIALIEMGDFVGAVLKHLRKVPVPRLTLCGGFGKISKLAAGTWTCTAATPASTCRNWPAGLRHWR